MSDVICILHHRIMRSLYSGDNIYVVFYCCGKDHDQKQHGGGRDQLTLTDSSPSLWVAKAGRDGETTEERCRRPFSPIVFNWLSYNTLKPPFQLWPQSQGAEPFCINH